MARKQRDRVLEQQWRERVARWLTSGLSVRAFCRQEALIEASFYYWKRVLRARDAETAPSSSAKLPTKAFGRKPAGAKKPAPAFVPLAVLPAATLPVEIRCPSGHVVLLSACDVASLTSLLASLSPPEREMGPC